MTYLHKVGQALKCGDFVLRVTNVSRGFVQGCALHTLGWLNCDRTKHVFSINSREYERASSRMASTKGCIKLKVTTHGSMLTIHTYCCDICIARYADVDVGQLHEETLRHETILSQVWQLYFKT